MKIRLKRGEEPKDVSRVTIFIGEDRYYLTETIDKRLCVNKISDGDSDSIRVHPRSGNEVDLS